MTMRGWDDHVRGMTVYGPGAEQSAMAETRLSMEVVADGR